MNRLKHVQVHAYIQMKIHKKITDSRLETDSTEIMKWIINAMTKVGRARRMIIIAKFEIHRMLVVMP